MNQSFNNLSFLIFFIFKVPGNTAQTAVQNMAFQKICGNFWNAADAAVVHSTVCSYTRPFRIGVHFDGDENIRVPGTSQWFLTLFVTGTVYYFCAVLEA